MSMNFETLASASAMLNEGKTTSISLCESVLEAIATNHSIGAFSAVLPETARQEARSSDRRRREGISRGPLDGIPIAIKDIIDTTPAICKAGLDHLSDYRPNEDASVVRILRDEGAVIVGVTETDTGAFGTLTLQTINPTAPDRIAGGSSGGSGAAVAAGMAFAAIGTDTGGSVRIPAACCSVAAFKPTFGRVDTTGVRPLARSFDHVGPLARCVEDLQIVQSVIDPLFSSTSSIAVSGPLRFGVGEEYYADADESVKKWMSIIIDDLRSDGHLISKSKLPRPRDVVHFHCALLRKEAAEYHDLNFRSHWRNYPEIARETIEMGFSHTEDTLQLARDFRSTAKEIVDEAAAIVDAILVPTLAFEVPLRETTSVELGGCCTPIVAASVRYTELFNFTGHPAVSLPAVKLPDGTGLSIQVVGAMNKDSRVLEVARLLEREFQKRHGNELC